MPAPPSTAAVLISAALVAQAPQNPSPNFKVAVEYVEVDARVLDAQGNAVRNLAKASFQVLEDGVAQDIATFSAIDIPVPTASATPPGTQARIGGVLPIVPDVASNAGKRDAARLYLIVFNDLFITPANTPEVRQVMRGFIERHVGPEDLVGVLTIGFSGAFQDFTSDKALLVSAIDRLVGAKDLSPTVDSLTNIEAKVALSPLGGTIVDRPPAATADKALQLNRSSQQMLVRIARSMTAIPGRSKAIIMVSEGALAATVNDLEGLSLSDELRAGSEIERHANVPIYPIDPRGLTLQGNESIEIGTVTGSVAPIVNHGLTAELRSSQEGLIRLAEDTGGAAALGNDFDAAFERIVRRSSAYYKLGYYSRNPRRDGKFRNVQIKVKEPGVTVVARRGYTAASDRAPAKPSFPGPAGASGPVREALNSMLPMNGLTLSASAAAFRARGSDASVAVVLESSGSDLALTPRNGSYAGPMEVLVAALDERGGIKSSEAKQLQFNLAPDVFKRVSANGFRWLSRLTLKPGRYQIRIAAASGPAKRGSVWYDLDVPDFSAGDLSMSGVLIASAAAFQTPTFKPDKELESVLPGPPTTLRTFPIGDDLVVFAEVYDNKLSEPHDVDVTVGIRTVEGIERFRTSESDSSTQLKTRSGIHRSVTRIPLNLVPGRYVLAIDARRRDRPERGVTRAIPFQVHK